jgi:hypothetical protein
MRGAGIVTALVVFDVLGMCLGGIAAIRETVPRERGRHRVR